MVPRCVNTILKLYSCRWREPADAYSRYDEDDYELDRIGDGRSDGGDEERGWARRGGVRRSTAHQPSRDRDSDGDDSDAAERRGGVGGGGGSSSSNSGDRRERRKRRRPLNNRGSAVNVRPCAAPKRCWQRRWEGLWAFALFTTAVWMVVWRASWAVFQNDAVDAFDWYIWDRTHVYHQYFHQVLILCTVTTVYSLVLLCLVVAHVALDVPLRMHWLHKIFVVVALLLCVVTTIAMYVMWADEMKLLSVNLYFTAPFLHLALVIILTLLFWPVGHVAVSAVKELEGRSWARDGGGPAVASADGSHAMRAMKSRGRYWCADACGRRSLKSLCVWMAVIAFFAWVYTIPLWVRSPCLGTASLVAAAAAEGGQTPPKPRIFGHRGAPAIAPENTMPSFEAAVRHGAFGLESDVQLSTDGVPFLLHDLTLLRTTNVLTVFPDRAAHDASSFTWRELCSLEAGYSFAKHDPFRQAHTVPESVLRSYIGTRIPPLDELLNLTRTTKRHLIFDLYEPPQGHPYHERYFDVVLDAVRAAHIDSQIFWLPGENRQRVVSLAPDFTQVEGTKEGHRPAADFLADHIDVTNSQVPTLSFKQLKRYNDRELRTLVWTVNSPWLFSLYWCGAYPYITSSNIAVLSNLKDPLFYLPRSAYVKVWVPVEVISLSLICVFLTILVKRMRSVPGVRRYSSVVQTESRANLAMEASSCGLNTSNEDIFDASAVDGAGRA